MHNIFLANMRSINAALLALISGVIITETFAAEAPIINPLKCNNQRPVVVNATAAIQQNVKLWQGIVLLLCLGAFGLFVCLIHRMIRTYIYYDAHLLDTYYDGGGDTNASLLAASVITCLVWPSTFSQPITDIREYGIVGHYWYAASLSTPIFVFCIMAAEVRIKAPGAKTFLQIIYARFGKCAHTIMMTFALVCNLMVVGMIMVQGTRVMVAVTHGLSHEVAAILIAVTVGIYTVVGGVGGSMYVSYFISVLYLAITMVFFTDVFLDPLQNHADSNEAFGSISKIFAKVDCGMVSKDVGNEQNSPLTFLSRGGMVEGVLLLLSGFSTVFVNQAYWQTGMAAKPMHSVWGFLAGGLVWVTVPFSLSLAFGMAYWVLSVHAGGHIVTEEAERHGLVPMYIAQYLMGTTGTFMMLVMTMGAVMTACASQVLAVSSILIYDVYMTYISPFKPAPIPDKEMSVRMQKAIRNEEYLEYDRRCVWLKHITVVCVTVLLIPITLVLIAVNVDVYWLFVVTGIVCGGCVMPIALAVTWHRTTASGVSAGAVGGFAAGVISWLVLASVQRPDGLMNFRENTTQWLPLLVGLTVPFFLGGLLCIMVSICCGGCDKDLTEEEEWEKTRQIDNPILPWSVKYAPDIGPENLTKGRPHFFTVRRTFKCAEISAYIFGVLLAVISILVLPASLLSANIFTEAFFTGWVYFVLAKGALLTALMVLVPFIWEIVQNCRQAYYNRMWAHSDTHGRLHEETSEDIHPDTGHRNPDTGLRSQDNGYAVSVHPVDVVPEVSEAQDAGDFHSQIEESSSKEREKWKTFIHLD